MVTVIEEALSLTNAHWQQRQCNDREILTITQRLNIPELLARIIVGRGISFDQAEQFLKPTLRDSMPDPFHLKDMDKAVDRLVTAIKNNESIAVFGDYDVDGATSSSLLIHYFKQLGITLKYHIPDRIKEGYGPNSPALLGLKEQGVDVCITVDCGTASFEPIEEAMQAGLDMIVVDHHIGAETLPAALAVINPNRLDETSPCKSLAAVGVTFLLLVALNKQLREDNYFADRNEPDLIGLLDIVALGTVCDVMKLQGLNRSFVTQGLKVLSKRQNIGIAALYDTAGIDEAPSVYHLGFILGPRINAGGRVGESDLGVRSLTSEDPFDAAAMAQKLNHYNAERKTIEMQVQEEAVLQIEENLTKEQAIIFAVGEGWHPGVIGIVAGRIKDKYHLPTAILTIDNGIAKASARSITGIDFGSAVINAKNQGLLVAGGGHSAAAGFSVEQDKIPALRDFFQSQFAPELDKIGRIKHIDFDGFVTCNGINMELAKTLQQAGPYGMGNPEPKLVIRNCYIIRSDILKEAHLRCLIKDGDSGGSGNTLKAMAFNCMDTELGQALAQPRGHRFDIMGKVKVNSWQGRESAEFIVEDARYAD